MGVVASIKDRLKGYGLRVYKAGSIGVVEHSHPPIEEGVLVRPFRERFSSSSGGIKMNVDGSTAPVDFCIKAEEDVDVFIKTIFFEIADDGAPALNKFGSMPALANGIQWIYFNNADGEYILHDGIKTNKEFVRLGIDTHGIGTGADAYLADTSGGGSEKAYLPIIDITEMYGIKYGIKLRKGSNDKLIFRINDDLTSVASIDAIAYGQRVDFNEQTV